MEKFLVEIEEVFRKKVVVWAENDEEVFEAAEQACNTGVVDATVEFTEFSRNVSVLNTISDDVAAHYPQVVTTKSAVAVIQAKVNNQ